MQKSTHDRSLVTFALFAYNHERFIREAVLGAFSQTYEPLEIILSDDGSSDRTFEIMREMAADYRGPHTVIVRQTTRNIRPYSHVLDVSSVSSGELIVLAAGDDVSVPERVTEICRAWKSSGAWALHSRYDVMDEKSQISARSQISVSLEPANCELHGYFYATEGPVYVVHGATSAYDRQLLELAPRDNSEILAEDGVFTILLNLSGRSGHFVEMPLVLYRQHSEAISHNLMSQERPNEQNCRALLSREMRYSKNIVDRGRLAMLNAGLPGLDARNLNTRAVKRDVLFHLAKSEWPTLNWRARLRAVFIGIRQNRIGFLIPSILGERLGPRYLAFRQSRRQK